MLFGRHITKHRATVPTDHRRPDGRSDMVITRCNVRGQRSQSVKGRLMTPLQLLLHVFLNEVHGHMSRPLVHHLHAAFPGPFRQVSLRLQLPELRLIVRIRQGTRTQSVPDREANVIRGHDIANVVPMSPKEVLLVMG